MTVSPITAPATDVNPGIVPPWLTGERNTGTVPPWLADAGAPARNPGIVPPWLTDPITILPIDEAPASPAAPVETMFVREAVGTSPQTLTDALAARAFARR